jgi:hypothetical protein
MRFVGALDAILTLPIVIGENLYHFIEAAGYILTDCRLDEHRVPDLEFCGHRFRLSR